ncbi:MAG: hypothetical protein VBE63_18215 [Lamprobacter sp.]|uniref:hypothetical protein n=1 Tax=Lamprobacter sp. TaxID=3100796 RepID=UPI002B2594A7|nr:hypothetical protein [Lamprobacter sp.]MEA3641850.1 hypothetical protein [Lamprobacter sp.]
MSQANAQCSGCSAWIIRPGYAPFCERGTYPHQIGCIKHQAKPPIPTQEHQGALPPPTGSKQKARRKS